MASLLRFLAKRMMAPTEARRILRVLVGLVRAPAVQAPRALFGPLSNSANMLDRVVPSALASLNAVLTLTLVSPCSIIPT